LILWWSPGMHALDVAVHRGKHRVPGDVPHQRAAALGIGKRDPTAGVRSPHPSRSKTRHSEVRTFATTTNSLLEPRDWLLAQRVSIVVMAATGDYRRPPFYLLEAALTVILVNAAHAQDLPGRASDGADAIRPAPPAECGLLRASVAPRNRSAGRVTRPAPAAPRSRSTLLTERSREVKRLGRELEEAAIKPSSVATAILGVSGRLLLQALIDADRDPGRAG
jgi:transposase